ncbi:unnamed protein product [Closterium sp. Yama58-4]|nr:unnamed protein product [Closterium sp. Yama58-4]
MLPRCLVLSFSDQRPVLLMSSGPRLLSMEALSLHRQTWQSILVFGRAVEEMTILVLNFSTFSYQKAMAVEA